MTIFKMIAYKIYESVIDITTAHHAHFFIEIANAFFQGGFACVKASLSVDEKRKNSIFRRTNRVTQDVKATAEAKDISQVSYPRC